MMTSNFKSAALGFAAGLAVAGAGAQAASQASQHEHSNPPAAKAAAGGMEDMEAMMADPAMRQKMTQHMGQCRDMMSMMMEHMGHRGEMAKQPPPEPKH